MIALRIWILIILSCTTHKIIEEVRIAKIEERMIEELEFGESCEMAIDELEWDLQTR